jgi:hypothetical protein
MERTIIDLHTGVTKVYPLTTEEVAARETALRTPQALAEQWSRVRSQRDALLRGTDWTEMPDAPAAIRNSKRAYRQALRDITLQADPYSIVWPEDN